MIELHRNAERLLERELARFAGSHPTSRALAARAGADHLLDRLIHLYALNRGVLLTPFHNMALMSPATTTADVDHHTDVVREAVRELRAG